jgi:hypothetical protein
MKDKQFFKIEIEHDLTNVIDVNYYVIVEFTHKNNSKSITRHNNGFEGFRLLGLLQWCVTEITNMLIPRKSDFTLIKRTGKYGTKFEMIEKNDKTNSTDKTVSK